MYWIELGSKIFVGACAGAGTCAYLIYMFSTRKRLNRLEMMAWMGGVQERAEETIKQANQPVAPGQSTLQHSDRWWHHED